MLISIHNATKGEAIPPVVIISALVIVAINKYVTIEAIEMSFLGIQKKDIKQINDVIAAKIVIGRLMIKDSFMCAVVIKFVQQYSATIQIDTRKTTSQIRRCQKRVNVTGLIKPPTTYVDLVDIMTIMFYFYK